MCSTDEDEASFGGSGATPTSTSGGAGDAVGGGAALGAGELMASGVEYKSKISKTAVGLGAAFLRASSACTFISRATLAATHFCSWLCCSSSGDATAHAPV